MESLLTHYPESACGQLRQISIDPFWPSIDLDELRARLGSIDGISDARLKVAALGAVERVNREFGKWRAVLRGRGYARLEDLTGGCATRASSLLDCYRCAIDASVQRELAQHLHVFESRLRRPKCSFMAPAGASYRD
jgi:hypothetical protein